VPQSAASSAVRAFIFVPLLAAGCGSDSQTKSTTPSPSPVAVIPTPSATPAVWKPVFADEFSTPGSLDPAKWSYEIGYLRNNEKQYYTSRSENIRVENGMLVIEARKEPYNGYSYTSASIETYGRFEFTYGRVEVRAKIPTGKGTWPAIWTLGSNINAGVGWPTCGEIDIMENVGYEPPTLIHGTVHTAAYNTLLGNQRTATVTVSNASQDFHVYAMEWYPDRIDLFIDGRKYLTFQNEGTGVRVWPFDLPQFLKINLAIGGDWGGLQGIDDSLFPHRYYIDYVRVFKG
jgi:beta-glucanase (GH16 family)